MKKLKKAFTIVELVIVIAVIAILAAVLIPTFVNVTRNAKLSADQQAVYNMNLVLQTDESLNGAPGNLKEAKEVLAEGGYNTKLTPSLSGYNYYWNSNYNIVMLIKVEGWELVYPLTNDANEAYTAYIGQCYNLSTNTTQDQDEILETVKAGGTVEMTEATLSDIIYLSREIGETYAGATVQLTDDLDLNGDKINPMYEFAGTFDGNGKTISNFSIVPVHGTDGNGYQYYDMTEYISGGTTKVTKDKQAYGIFGALTEGGVVKDLNVVYADAAAPAEPGSEYTYFGGIVGILDGGTVENCTVSGSIHQYNRVGGIVGTALAGTIKDCTVTADITSYAVNESSNGARDSFANYSYVGGLIAYTGNRVRESSDVVSVTGCTVGSADGITLKASGYAAGGITAWMSYNSDLTVSDTTIKNVIVDLTSGVSFNLGPKPENLAAFSLAAPYYASYSSLLVGNISTNDVTLTLSSVTLSGTNKVSRYDYDVHDASFQNKWVMDSYTAQEEPSTCTTGWETVRNNTELYLTTTDSTTNLIRLLFNLSLNNTGSNVIIGTITG